MSKPENEQPRPKPASLEDKLHSWSGRLAEIRSEIEEEAGQARDDDEGEHELRLSDIAALVEGPEGDVDTWLEEMAEASAEAEAEAEGDEDGDDTSEG